MKALDGVPDLRLVPTHRVRFHELAERSRTSRLVERMRRERFLRNPPIVAELGADDFMLLDGANRVSAFREIGWSHVPVQVIDYGDDAVQLKGWHHLLLQGKALDLKAAYEKLPGVRVERVGDGELGRVLELRRAHAVLVDDATNAWGLFPESGRVELTAWRETLEAVVAAYEGRTALERIKIADFRRLPDVLLAAPHQLVLFPTVTKAELLAFAFDDERIPTGITRHLIPGRALGLHLPLEFLETAEDDAAKVAFFRDFVETLERSGRIRYYEESVFIMNE